MEFNEQVLEKIAPLFQAKGFKIAEQYKNFFRFKSNFTEATISYNELDMTSLFEVGKNGGFLYPVKDNALRHVFGSDRKFNQQTKEIFINHIASFLKLEGSDILEERVNKLNDLKYFIESESKIYTSQIKEKQILIAANKAWDNHNYGTIY